MLSRYTTISSLFALLLSLTSALQAADVISTYKVKAVKFDYFDTSDEIQNEGDIQKTKNGKGIRPQNKSIPLRMGWLPGKINVGIKKKYEDKEFLLVYNGLYHKIPWNEFINASESLVVFYAKKYIPSSNRKHYPHYEESGYFPGLSGYSLKSGKIDPETNKIQYNYLFPDSKLAPFKEGNRIAYIDFKPHLNFVFGEPLVEEILDDAPKINKNPQIICLPMRSRCEDYSDLLDAIMEVPDDFVKKSFKKVKKTEELLDKETMAILEKYYMKRGVSIDELQKLEEDEELADLLTAQENLAKNNLKTNFYIRRDGMYTISLKNANLENQEIKAMEHITLYDNPKTALYLNWKLKGRREKNELIDFILPDLPYSHRGRKTGQALSMGYVLDGIIQARKDLFGELLKQNYCPYLKDKDGKLMGLYDPLSPNIKELYFAHAHAFLKGPDNAIDLGFLTLTDNNLGINDLLIDTFKEDVEKKIKNKLGQPFLDNHILLVSSKGNPNKCTQFDEKFLAKRFLGRPKNEIYNIFFPPAINDDESKEDDDIFESKEDDPPPPKNPSEEKSLKEAWKLIEELKKYVDGFTLAEDNGINQLKRAKRPVQEKLKINALFIRSKKYENRANRKIIVRQIRLLTGVDDALATMKKNDLKSNHKNFQKIRKLEADMAEIIRTVSTNYRNKLAAKLEKMKTASELELTYLEKKNIPYPENSWGKDNNGIVHFYKIKVYVYEKNEKHMFEIWRPKLVAGTLDTFQKRLDYIIPNKTYQAKNYTLYDKNDNLITEETQNFENLPENPVFYYKKDFYVNHGGKERALKVDNKHKLTLPEKVRADFGANFDVVHTSTGIPIPETCTISYAQKNNFNLKVLPSYLNVNIKINENGKEKLLSQERLHASTSMMTLREKALEVSGLAPNKLQFDAFIRTVPYKLDHKEVVQPETHPLHPLAHRTMRQSLLEDEKILDVLLIRKSTDWEKYLAWFIFCCLIPVFVKLKRMYNNLGKKEEFVATKGKANYDGDLEEPEEDEPLNLNLEKKPIKKEEPPNEKIKKRAKKPTQKN